MPSYLHAAELGEPERIRFEVGGTHVAGHLYRPSEHRDACPAVAVAGSLTSVKEQMGGIHAAEMAKRGIIALAIDYRHYGESGGDPRQYEDPATKAEDLSAAVAYLKTLPNVRPEGVGLLGVCTSGGNVVEAAAHDEKVRAVATVAGHFAEPAHAPQFYTAMFGEGREIVDRFREQGRAARELYERTGENRLVLAYSNVNRAASHIGPMEYYIDHFRGGGVPQWHNAFAAMSWERWLAFDPVSAASEVRVPTLMVHSDGCVMPEQARKLYGRLAGPKRLHWTTGAHFDFYDGPEKVREAADVVAQHFHECLTAEVVSA